VFTNCELKVRLVGQRLAVGAAPVRPKLTVWGLPEALSVMVTEALRAPVADGVNATLIVQFPPAATLLPQLFVCAKSPGFVSVIATAELLKVALPALETVTA
jgi:hypothetical protein